MSFTIIRTLISLWLAHFLVDFMIGIFAIYKTLAHIDLFSAGLISSMGAFLGEGMQVFFGPLSDRGWRKYLICFGLLITAASGFLAYFSSFWLLLCLFSATCLGSGAFHPSAVSLAGALTPHRKALMITIFASGGSFGLAFSQIVYAHFYSYLDGQTAILILPTAILCIALLFYGLKGMNQFTPVVSSKKVNLKALFALYKVPDLRNLYIAQVANQSIFWAFIFFLPDMLLCKGYETWLCHGGGHLFLILGGALMMVPSGYLSDRYSPKYVLLAATMGAMTCFYLFLFTDKMSSAPLLALVFTLGAFLGTINPVLIAFGNRLVPESPGMISAFLMGMAWCVAEGVGQGGGGYLTLFFEEQAPIYALAILGSLFLVGISATALLPSLKTEKQLA
jgi:FSR family fosmidomycin resistance protein-like MFS transporter